MKRFCPNEKNGKRIRKERENMRLKEEKKYVFIYTNLLVPRYFVAHQR